jgi:hypothetical protein
MEISFSCPKCGRGVRIDGLEGRASVGCEACGWSAAVPAGSVSAGRVRRCVVCPSDELFVRKDFPQRVGFWIVVAGFAASCVTWGLQRPLWTFAILFGTATVDVVLYLLVGDCLSCYRCGARYRGPGITARHAAFDLETHEKHRQVVARSPAAAAVDSREHR